VITESGNTLCTTTSGTAQWFLDGEALAGDGANCIEAVEAGSYTVVVTDAAGCVSASSAPVQVISTGLSAAADDAVIRLHPNPARHQVRLERASSTSALVTFVDPHGRRVHEQRITGMTATLDVSTLATGVYLLRVSDGSGSHVVRLVKE